MDFSETIVVYGVKVGMYCKLNEYMKTRMCLRSRSFFTLVQCHSDFVVVNIFKYLLLEITRSIKVKFHLDLPWDEETKVCSTDPGHMTNMAVMSIYGKNI